MATTISIREEAYDRLADRKRADESFTDVVLRLTAEDPRDFSNLVGADVEVSWEAIESSRERTDGDERREAFLEERVRAN